jgi:hypothetical protein
MEAEELKPDVTFIVIGEASCPMMNIANRSVDACDPSWAEGCTEGACSSFSGEMGANAGRIVLADAADPMGAEEVWRHPELMHRVDCFNTIVRETARRTGATVADLAAEICPSRTCTLLSEGAHRSG